jgi:hypothetical protein
MIFGRSALQVTKYGPGGNQQINQSIITVIYAVCLVKRVGLAMLTNNQQFAQKL